MPGEFGAPYREICGGWPDSPRLFLSACHNHIRNDEKGIDLYENTTTVGDPPQQPENGDGGPANPCVEGDTEIDGNCYTPLSSGTDNYASCRKQGYKAVHAKRYWHGAYGFGKFTSDACSPGCTYELSDTKYLKCEMDMALSYTSECGADSFSIAAHTTAQVDSNSGVVNISEATIAMTVAGVPVDRAYWYDWLYTATEGWPALAAMFCYIDVNCNGAWSFGKYHLYSSAFAAFLNGTITDPMGWPSWTTVTKEWSQGHVKVELVGSQECDAGPPSKSEHVTISIEKTYTVENTADAVYGDVQTLLGEFDMTDDVVMPWRTDAACNGAPLVARDEIAGASEPPYDPLWVTEGEAGGIEALGNQTDETGAIIGSPLPAGYTTPPGTSPGWAMDHYSFRQQQWVGGGGTHTTEDPENWFDGAFVSLVGDVVTARKWAMIKDTHPSYNFFRPCGADRDDPLYPTAWPICGRIMVSAATQDGSEVDITLEEDATYLRTGDTVDFTSVPGLDSASGYSVTVTDATHFTVTGTLSEEYTAGAGYVMSHGAVAAGYDYWWNDTGVKGDYVLKEWEWDMCAATTTLTCTEECILAVPCSPTVLCISPNAEDWNSGTTHPFPTTTPDHVVMGNGLWQGICRAVMNDPIDGSPTMVEARCSPPAEAPDPPATAVFGCEDPTSCPPPNLLECWGTEEIEYDI